MNGDCSNVTSICKSLNCNTRQTVFFELLQHLFVDDNKPKDLGLRNLNGQCLAYSL